MKKISFLIAMLFVGIMITDAQVRIALTSYKQIEMNNNKWQDWPNTWTSYASEGRSNPEVELSVLEPTLGFHNLKLFIDGAMVAEFRLIFDPEKSAEMRTKWNDKYVNCYTDENGDYVYFQGLSLEGLIKNVNGWASNSNSKIYMWMPSNKLAIVVK